MGRVRLSASGRKSPRPVVLHLDRAVAHELLQALTQAVEPHATNIGKFKQKSKGFHPKGVSLKAKSLTGEVRKGKSPKGKSSKGNKPKGKPAKKSG